VLERYVGSYTTDRGPAKIAIAGGSLTIQVGRQSPIPLIPVSEAEFRLEGMDATIAFHLAAGAVTGFTFRQGEHEIQAERDSGS
jgi:hypothetical protein